MSQKFFDPENWTPSKFTQALKYVLPGLAYKRMRNEFAYDAAQASTKRKYAPQNINPNDYQTQRDRLQLMREAFDLEKNFAPAKAVNRKHALFSSPTSYYAQTGDSILSKEVEEYLNEDWFQNCDISCRYDFFEMMRFGIMGMNSGGDYGWGYIRPGATDDMEVDDLVKLPLMIQGVEPDRIGGIYQNVVSDDYVAGVIIGQYGQPTHYRIFKRSLVVSQYTDPIDVPASQFVHMTDPMRIDMYRGVSKLDTGSAPGRDFYETWEAMRGKQKLAASLTVFTNSNGAVQGGSTLDPYQTAIAPWGYNGMQQDIHQNMINHLTGGSEIKFPETATPGGEGQFLLTMDLKFFCLCYDLPYSFGLDATDLGGVSTRLESEIAKAEFQRTQKIVSRKATVLKNAALLDACAKGIFPSKYYNKIIKGRWGFRPHPQPDLGKEAQAAATLRQQGILSEPQYISENYGDVETWATEKDRFVTSCKNALTNGNSFEEVFGTGPVPQGAASAQVKDDDDNSTTAGTANGVAPKSAERNGKPKEFADVSGEARDKDGKWTGGANQAGSPKLTKAQSSRKTEIESQSTPAPKDAEYYHGTSATNVESILKNGILPTDKTLGVPSAFVGASKDLAHAYGGGSAADNDHDKVAIIVVKGGSGLVNFRGEKNVGISVGQRIPPSSIDRIEIYRVNAGKDEKPLQILKPQTQEKKEYGVRQIDDRPHTRLFKALTDQGMRPDQANAVAYDIIESGKFDEGRLPKGYDVEPIRSLLEKIFSGNQVPVSTTFERNGHSKTLTRK